MNFECYAPVSVALSMSCDILLSLKTHSLGIDLMYCEEI